MRPGTDTDTQPIVVGMLSNGFSIADPHNCGSIAVDHTPEPIVFCLTEGSQNPEWMAANVTSVLLWNRR